MKRLLIFLLTMILTFSACGSLHTAEPAPTPTPGPTVTPTCAEPATEEEQLLHDIGPALSNVSTSCDMTLCGTAEYKGRQFAMIAVEGVSNTLHLVEYQSGENGYTLLGACDGWAFSAPGYIPIVTDFDGLIVCWSYITTQRLVPDSDGNGENDVYIPMDYTHIRMTLADGTVRDEPITADLQGDHLFFCVLDGDNLPTGFVPLVGDTEVTEWATGTGEPVDIILNDDQYYAASEEVKLIDAAEETLHFSEQYPITAELLGTAEAADRLFALVSIQNDTYSDYLVEYTVTDGNYEIIAWSGANGQNANAFTTGYWPIYAKFGDTKLCWSIIPDSRTATSPNGALILKMRCDNDYTAIRFVMPDGSTIDAPVPEDLSENRLVLQLLKEWPDSAVPMAGDIPITAYQMDCGLSAGT